MMLLASAGGNRVPVIAQLVQADEDTVRPLRLTAASRNYSRNLVVDTGRSRPASVAIDLDMARASDTLLQSIEVVAQALTGPRDGEYIRSSSLFFTFADFR